MSMKSLKDYFKELFHKKLLAENIIFKEKPSVILLLLVYALAILAIILVWKFSAAFSPIITAQITVFFKGLKAEFVEVIMNKIQNLLYTFIIILPVIYHLKREMTSFTLTKKELKLVKGLFVRKETFIPLSKVLTVSVHISLLGNLAHYGTIYVDVGGHSYPIILENVNSPKEIAGKILEQL